MEGQLYYQVTNTVPTSKAYVNLTRDLSALNSKNFEHTTRDGHVVGYMCNVAILGGSSQIFRFSTAANTWKMRNSFRKFHAYRNLMFKNAGVTEDEKGRYGKTIRPYLNYDHFAAETGLTSNAVLEPRSDIAAFEMGDWTYSRLATTPLYEVDEATAAPEMGTSILTVADEWPLTICDRNQVQASEDFTSGTYTTVGMIHSYNIDRMEVITPTADETVDGPSNPLAALIASGNQAAGEILDITNEQELEKPPYDLADGGDSVEPIVRGIIKVPTTLGITRTSMFVPAGLFELQINGSGNYNLYIDVVGQVLCKDLQ